MTPGLIDKHYAQFVPMPGSVEDVNFGQIVHGNNHTPWQGYWRATGAEKELPNIFSIKWTTDFSQKGCRTATVELENIVYKAIAGVGGIYHAILHGALSPWVGLSLVNRIRVPGWEADEWFEVLDSGFRIDIYEGYGSELCHTFAGLIENADLETKPDRIILTARDFGILFTDQRVLAENKAPEIRSPLQAADLERTLGIEPVGIGPVASSTGSGFPVGNITKPGSSQWHSAGHASAANTEWVEITIPPGFYETLTLNLPVAEQAVYVSIFAKGTTYWRGEKVAEGWLGGGEVPVTATPFTWKYGSTYAGSKRLELGGKLEAGKGCVLRISLTNLHFSRETKDYRASVTRLAAMRFGQDPEHPAGGILKSSGFGGWLLVNDTTDIVKQVFLWAGFKEWRIDKFGWSPGLPFGWAKEAYFVDIITQIEEQADWVFFMESPTELAGSMGRPCFEHSTATVPPKRDMLEVRDTDLLEAVKFTIDLSNLPYIIRYRGNVDPSGTVTDGDLVKRYSGIYYPPWSGAGPFPTEAGRTGGVRRHELTVDPNLQSDEECIFGAILAAWQYALGAYTAEVQMSGYPGMELNDHISVVDKATGVNSRLWVSGIQSEHICGAKAAWKMSVKGSVLDGKDTQQIASDLEVWKEITKALRALKDPIGVGGGNQPVF